MIVPVIANVLVVLLPVVVVVIVTRPPRLPVLRVVEPCFHTNVNGVAPVSVVVKVAVVPAATCWLLSGVVVVIGTHNWAVSVFELTVVKFVPDTLPVLDTVVAVDGLVSGLLTVTWNLTITLFPAGSVPIRTSTGADCGVSVPLPRRELFCCKGGAGGAVSFAGGMAGAGTRLTPVGSHGFISHACPVLLARFSVLPNTRPYPCNSTVNRST